MQSIIQMSLPAVTSESGFSLDEFVIALSDLMEREGMAGVAGLVLSLIQEQLCIGLCQDRPGARRPAAIPAVAGRSMSRPSDCDRMETGTDTMDLLFADGTGYKRRPDTRRAT